VLYLGIAVLKLKGAKVSGKSPGSELAATDTGAVAILPDGELPQDI
jgi:hypothetical protein